MNWDDEFDNENDDMAHDPHRDNAMTREGPVGALDPMDIADPERRSGSKGSRIGRTSFYYI